MIRLVAAAALLVVVSELLVADSAQLAGGGRRGRAKFGDAACGKPPDHSSTNHNHGLERLIHLHGLRRTIVLTVGRGRLKCWR
jgi:hypothetical protein